MQLKPLLRMIDDKYQYFGILPLIIILIILVFAPVVQLFSTCFHVVGFMSGGLSFTPVGFQNYATALNDRVALRALLNTTALAIISVSIEVVLAIILALAVGYAKRGQLLYRTDLFFLCSSHL